IAPRLVVGSGPPTWLALCAFLALAGLSWLEGRRRAPSELAAALLLDQRLDRRGQLAAAYDFSLSKHHDAYQALLLQSEASFLATSPVHQLALRVPRGWPVALICQCAFLIALAIPARQRPTSPAP